MNIWKNRNWGPMLLKEADKPFNSKDYIYEIKYDGIRACIYVSPNSFQIISRNKIDMTNIYPELKSIQNLVDRDIILDGEIVSFKDNKPSFSKLQERNHLKNKDKIKKESINNPVTFIAFDILYYDKDITSLTLLERKEILNKIKENDELIISKFYKNGIDLFKKIKKLDLEGIVAKKIDDSYEINKRTFSFIKVKNLKEEEFTVGGYEIKKGDYISLVLGELKNNKLYFVGKVSLTKNNNLYNKVINSKTIKKSPFINYDNKNTIYISNNIKCKVKYLERTKSNHLRQPIIKKEIK